MASFSDFLATLDPDSGRRGRQFEHFVKWFLKNDPEWATQVDQIWLWNDYPGQWGRDCGIDLVFKDKIGATWAVQAKCYSPGYEITKSDVDKFLSESNRKTINHRLLITTTDRIGANARQVLDGQEKSVVRYHLRSWWRGCHPRRWLAHTAFPLGHPRRAPQQLPIQALGFPGRSDACTLNLYLFTR